MYTTNINKKKLENNKTHKKTKNNTSNNNTLQNNHVYSNDILIDSGAGINVTNKREWLLNFQESSSYPKYYGVGNPDIPLDIRGSGYLPIKTGDNEITRLFCYYVPEEDATIISADKLWNEAEISLGRGYYELIDNKNNTVRTKKINNTIWVESDKLINDINNKVRAIKAPNILIRRPNISLLEAHLRLNHIPAKIIHDSIKNNIFDDVITLKESGNNPHWCEICSAAKMTRHMHYRDTMNHYQNTRSPGSSWSMDVFGPIHHLPVDGDKYMLLMVDNVSRFLMITTHKTKEAKIITEQVLKNIKYINNQFDRKLKEIIMDRGTENTNSEMRSMFSKYGIQPIYTSTQDHSANARAERNIRTIINDTRTLLTQSNLPLKFWSYAAKASANVRNCTYNKQIQDAPLNMISRNDVKIILQSFLPFGSPALIWNHKSTKLTSQGTRAIVLCKDSESFGYKFYIPKTKEVITTTNYSLPNFLVRPELRDDNDNDIIGTFISTIDKKLGNIETLNSQQQEIDEELMDIKKNDEDFEEISMTEDEQLIYKKLVQTEEEEKNETAHIPQIEFNNIDNLPLDTILSPLEEESDNKNENSSFGKFSYTNEEKHNDTGDNKIEDTTNKVNHTHENNEDVDEIMNSGLNEEIITNSPFNSSTDSTNHNIDDHSQSIPEKQKEQKDSHITETSKPNTNEYESEGDSEFQEDNKYESEGDSDFQEENEIAEETYDDISDENIDEEEIIEILADNVSHTLENNSTKEGNIEVTEIEKEMIEEFERKINKLEDKLNFSDDEEDSEDVFHNAVEYQHNNDNTLDTQQIENNKETIDEDQSDKQILKQRNPDNTRKEQIYKDNSKNTKQKIAKNKSNIKITKNKILSKNLNSLANHNKSTRRLDQTVQNSNVQHTIPPIHDAQAVELGYKKQRVKLIYPQENWWQPYQPKIHAIFYNEAIKNNKNKKEREKYLMAYNKEINNLITMNVIDPHIQINRDEVSNKKIIPINTLFTIKRDGTYKSRIVCRGDLQSEDTYGITETSILSIESLKLLLIIANNRNLRLRTFDINHAFLYADLEEELYIPHPHNNKYITPLKKALYGLKQSPKQWNDKLKSVLNKIGLFDSVFSPGLYVSNDCSIILAAYVDDCIIAAKNDSIIESIIDKIKENFSLKIVGVMHNNIIETDILGLDLHYDRSKGIVKLGLTTYINSIMKHYPEIRNDKTKVLIPHMNGYTINPKIDELVMSKSEYKEKVKYLQELIGRLNYVRGRCRFDIEFAVGKISRLVLYPHDKVIRATEKILKYLDETKELQIVFNREEIKKIEINGMSDASLGTEYDGKSRAGGIIWIGNNLLTAFSKKSSIVCDSSGEAELDALNMVEKITLLTKFKIIKLLHKQEHEIKTNLMTDSKNAFDWLRQNYIKPRTKFIGLRIERLKERTQQINVDIVKIKGLDNWADMFTKPSTRKNFDKVVSIIKNFLKPKVLLSKTEREVGE